MWWGGVEVADIYGWGGQGSGGGEGGEGGRGGGHQPPSQP